MSECECERMKEEDVSERERESERREEAHLSVSHDLLGLLTRVVEEEAALVQEHVPHRVLGVVEARAGELGPPRRVAAGHEHGGGGGSEEVAAGT